MKYFRRLARGFDITPAVQELEQHPGLWDVFTLRQDYPGSAHQDTQAIVLRGPFLDCPDVMDSVRCTVYPFELSKCWGLTYEVGALLRNQLGDIDLGRIMLVRLRAGGAITSHRDEGGYARHFQRYHLVLTSSPQCRFAAGGEAVVMAPGEVWWFDHEALHTVVNDGQEARIHLIVDAASPPGDEAA